MKIKSLESVLAALNRRRVRYIVVGGLAVAAHGYGRVTFDADLVVQLRPGNLKRALHALGLLGYRPTAPVAALDFTEASIRRKWSRERNMKVFQLQSDRHRDTPIDLFVSEPFNFDLEYARAMVGDLRPGLQVRFVRLETLIRMKKSTGRGKDREDVRQLRLLKEMRDGG